MIHQPPCCSGGRIWNPYSGPGGFRDSQGSWRMNWTGLQFTEASMFKPMISKATKPKTSDRTPVTPR